jgi:hypothetical protein
MRLFKYFEVRNFVSSGSKPSVFIEICSDLVYGELRREIEGGGGFS